MNCPDFWCIFTDCCSYPSGEFCPICSRFCECESCVLEHTSPNIDACHQLAYDILHGVSEEEDS